MLDAARRLDRKCLRGLKPASGLAALRAHVDQAKFGDEADRQRVVDLVERLDAATSDLAAQMATSAAPQALLDATVAAAERIASPDRLWSGEAGEALADTLAGLRTAWQDHPAIAGSDWPALFDDDAGDRDGAAPLRPPSAACRSGGRWKRVCSAPIS